MESDDGLLTNCESTAKWCEPIFLGDDIGWASVFQWNDADQDCALDILELTRVCSEFYEECLAFLYGATPEPSVADKCAPIYLGEDVGFVDVMGFFDFNGDCTMQASEITAMCAEYESMCLSFIGSKRAVGAKNPCAPIYLGEDNGFADIFKFYDDGDCILQASELSRICAAVPAMCRAFLYGNQQTCSPMPLGGAVSWATIFSNYSSAPCKVNVTQMGTLCAGQMSQCKAFGNFSTCKPLYLGDGIGFVDVKAASNSSECVVDLNVLSTACAKYSAQCTTFLQAGKCKPVWLGSRYEDVYSYDSVRGECRLDGSKLSSACSSGGVLGCKQSLTKNGCPAGWHDPDQSIVTGCLACKAGQFSAPRSTTCSSCLPGWADTDNNPATPCQKCAKGTTSYAGSTHCASALDFCPPVNLGPHVGFQRVFQWSATDASCVIVPSQLVAACGQKYYAECTAFLGNINRNCDPVYLGDKIGWVAVLNWDASSSTCQVNHGELKTVCSNNMQECVAFLQASHGMDCDPSYLGPKTGWASVYKMVNGKCLLDDGMVKSACGTNYAECKTFVGPGSSGAPSTECQPLWLGNALGWANVFHWQSATKSCQLDSTKLQKICVGNEAACHFAISSGVRAITAKKKVTG
jgi:hypothetical protein